MEATDGGRHETTATTTSVWQRLSRAAARRAPSATAVRDNKSLQCSTPRQAGPGNGSVPPRRSAVPAGSGGAVTVNHCAGPADSPLCQSAVIHRTYIRTVHDQLRCDRYVTSRVCFVCVCVCAKGVPRIFQWGQDLRADGREEVWVLGEGQHPLLVPTS